MHVAKLQDLVLLPTFLEPLLEPNNQGRPQLHGLASACRELKNLVSKGKLSFQQKRPRCKDPVVNSCMLCMLSGLTYV